MTHNQRLAEVTKMVNHIVPASRSAGAVTVTGIDTVGYDAARFVVALGDIGASTTLDAKVQECETADGTYTDVTDAAIAQLGASDDNALREIDVILKGPKTRQRYLKLLATVGGSNAAVFGAVCELYRAHATPVSKTPAPILA